MKEEFLSGKLLARPKSFNDELFMRLVLFCLWMHSMWEENKLRRVRPIGFDEPNGSIFGKH